MGGGSSSRRGSRRQKLDRTLKSYPIELEMELLELEELGLTLLELNDEHDRKIRLYSI